MGETDPDLAEIVQRFCAQAMPPGLAVAIADQVLARFRGAPDGVPDRQEALRAGVVSRLWVRIPVMSAIESGRASRGGRPGSQD